MHKPPTSTCTLRADPLYIYHKWADVRGPLWMVRPHMIAVLAPGVLMDGPRRGSFTTMNIVSGDAEQVQTGHSSLIHSEIWDVTTSMR